MNSQREIFESDMSQFKGDKTSALVACGIISIHIAAGIIAAALSYLAFNLSIYLGLFLYLPAVLFIGTRWRAVNNMSHECFHIYFTQKKKWNDRFGVFLGIIEFGSYYDFREEHASHHRYLGDFNADLDFKGFEKFNFSDRVTKKNILSHLYFALCLRHIKDYFFLKLYIQRDPLWAKFVRAAYFITLIVSAVMFPLIFVAYFLIPFVVIYHVIKYLTDYLDHGGLLDNEDPLRKSRNCYIKNWVIRKIAFPRHDCFHLVHHLYPAVPNNKLQDAHKWLLGKWPEYNKLEHNFYNKIVIVGSGIKQ